MLIIEQEALQHVWLSGENATDHNLIPEIRAYLAKARLRRGVELVKLANRIESLKLQEDQDLDAADKEDMPSNARQAAGEALAANTHEKGLNPSATPPADTGGKKLSRLARGAIFKEIVLAKVREMKEQQEREKVERSASEYSKDGKS